MNSTTTILISAGTYHFPFDRLLDWFEPWWSQHPEVDPVVQHGPGRGLPGATNHATLPYDELIQLITEADVVLLQGGAGAVMDARSAGRIPIVVPRIPVNNEVVDDHQIRFCRAAAKLGLVHLAENPRILAALLDEALAGELCTRALTSGPTPGTIAFAAELATLPPVLSASVRWRRLAGSVGWMIRARGKGTIPADSTHRLDANGHLEQPQHREVDNAEDK